MIQVGNDFVKMVIRPMFLEKIVIVKNDIKTKNCYNEIGGILCLEKLITKQLKH